ncbi:serine/threonine protein kinase [Sphingomonas sp. JC676]|uniref:serine/threonine-protein kinase n=1 Tax=Sphingomonas sp. JC676 TaxID=2768065 RepID=UPI0016582294|nr:serine/threonine-protein kinase [Sphingomonas sp. JC676]MBC9031895.1 serine/threonine protein kinase [Sphingomonas sp. JC676]
MQSQADIERRALALVERIADRPNDARFEARLLARENDVVRRRVAALKAALTDAAGILPTEFAGDAIGTALPPPERCGPFRLVRLIGEGGMGDVWLGQRDDGLYEQRVAVKLIRNRLIHVAGAAFAAERRILARLEHPNIARLIDGGIAADGTPFLVMEYVDGRPIDEAAAGLPIADRIRLFVKAADAVQFAHGQLIVHADLKPSNMMVDATGRVKLLDFGIARLINDEGEAPAVRPMTRAFASPARQDGGHSSIADDIYALGVTLGMIVGATSDRELQAIIAKAKAPEENRRYGSVAALIADLERWQAHLPVTAVPDDWRYRARKFISRHRLGVIATAIALLALTAISVIATASYVRAERTRIRAEQRFTEVRQLSNFILFDLYDELARVPGTVAKRAQIAETASRYLERLQLAGETPRDLNLEVARSYRRLAGIQGLPGISNVGRPDQAGRSLDKAEALLRALLAKQPQDADALDQLGWVQIEQWMLQGWSKHSARLVAAARQSFAAASKLAPANPSIQLGAIAAERIAAYELTYSGDKPREAIATARAALQHLRARIWPPPLTGDAAKVEVLLLNILGDATYYADDIPGSLPIYQQADRAIDRQLAQRGPFPHLLIAKGQEAFNISAALADMGGHLPEALVAAERGVTTVEHLLASGPDGAAEKTLLILYGQQAAVLEQQKRYAEALVPNARSIALRNARLRAAPNDPARMRDMAIALAPSARILALAGHGAEACAAARSGEAMWKAIEARGDLGDRDRTHQLPKIQGLIAGNCPNL